MNDKAAYIDGNDNSHLPTGQSNADINFVRREHVMVSNLPEPGKKWAVRDLRESDEYPDITGVARRLENASVIRSDETEYRDVTNKKVKIYETDRAAYERAQRYLETIDTLPCCGKGTGFKNVGTDGDEPPYKCTACGARHDRETVIESGVLS